MARNKSRTPPTLDLSGVYYNPEKSGWGVFIDNFGEETHSVAIYTHNERGGQVWLVGAAPRTTGFFQLTETRATGFMDSIRNKIESDAGTIEFTDIGNGKLQYKALINSLIVYPSPQFSPPPPAILEFSGVVNKLG
jgi:hypothetical protein